MRHPHLVPRSLVHMFFTFSWCRGLYFSPFQCNRVRIPVYCLHWLCYDLFCLIVLINQMWLSLNERLEISLVCSEMVTRQQRVIWFLESGLQNDVSFDGSTSHLDGRHWPCFLFNCFQQDGVLTLYSLQVREGLDNTRFGVRWIVRKEPRPLPPRSIDMTPLDPFCLGVNWIMKFITKSSSFKSPQRKTQRECWSSS